MNNAKTVSYTHLRAHETRHDLVCRLLLRWGPWHFYPLSCPSLHKMFLYYLQFFWTDLWLFSFYYFPLYLCIAHLSRPSCLSLLFFGSVHSIFCNFPYLPCILFPFSAICSHFTFLLFLFFGMVFVAASCTMLRASIQSSSGTQSNTWSSFNLFFTSTVYS